MTEKLIFTLNRNRTKKKKNAKNLFSLLIKIDQKNK